MAVTATTARHMIIAIIGDTPAWSVQYTSSLTGWLLFAPEIGRYDK